MDPLSLTASLLTVIAAAQVGLNGLRKLNEYYKASREIEELTAELETVQGHLKYIRAIVEADEHALRIGSLEEPVQRAADKIAALNHLLASPTWRFTKLSLASQDRLVWIRSKHKLLTLRDEIRVIKLDLAVRLGLVTAQAMHQPHIFLWV